jgi:hypothetical protein
MQTIRSFKSGIKKNQFTLSCVKWKLNFFKVHIFKLHFPVENVPYIYHYVIFHDFLFFLSLLSEFTPFFCPSENVTFKNFTVYCNKHNQHSVSITTLIPSAVLPTPIQLYYLQQISALSLIPQFTWQKKVDCNNLQWLWSKM